MANNLESFWGKCEILYKGSVFSNHQVIKLVDEYFSKTFNNDEKKTLDILLHSGNICYDVILFIYAAVKNIYCNELNSEMTVSSLKKGDLVIYDREFRGKVQSERRQFVEIIEENGHRFAKLKKDDDTFNYIPDERWNMIHPYHGTSTKLNGVGIRKKTTIKEQFYEEILGVKSTSEVETSSVIVINKKRASDIVKNTSFRFNGKKISFLEAFTVSHYTSTGEEINYSGNSSHSEPLLKIASDMSTARDLLKNSETNKNIGLIIVGDKMIKKGYTEYEFMIKKRSLKYAVVSMTIDSESVEEVLNNIEDASVFAITQQLLQSMNVELEHNSESNSLISDELSFLRDTKKSYESLKGITNKKEYYWFLNKVDYLRNSDYESEELDEFIILSYQLNNLFVKAPFSIRIFEDYLSKNEKDRQNPIEMIEILKRNKNNFSGSIKECSEDIIDYLSSKYRLSYDNEEKISSLKDYLREQSQKSRKGVVVVPKNLYISVLQEYLSHSSLAFYVKNDVIFTTPGRVDKTKKYDYIYSFESKKFNAEKIINALDVKTVLYDCEIDQYKKKQKNNNRLINRVNRESKKYTKLPTETLNEDISISKKYDIEDIDDEYETIVQAYYLKNEMNDLSKYYYSQGNHLKSLITCVVKFTNGQKAYLTKNYKAFIFNDSNKEVIVKSTDELIEGDVLIFKKGTGDSLDFVDGVLRELIDNHNYGAEIEEKYWLSKLWKNELYQYLLDNNITVRDAAKKMRQNGAPVNEATIINWLSPGSHIVGPQKEESIRHIGLLTNNAVLKNEHQKVYQACREIRSKRRSILNIINDAIIRKKSEKKFGTGVIDKYVYENIDDLSEELVIETITNIEKELPMHITNKPINVNKKGD